MSVRVTGTRCSPVLALLCGVVLGGCSSTSTVVITHHELRLHEDEFRIEPRSVSVPPGRLKVVVTNGGVLAHNLVLERAGTTLLSFGTILPGQQGGPLKVTLTPGTYYLASTLSNQSNLGMMATLHVRSH